MYQTIFDNIYNRIAKTPDFPQKKVTRLFEALPSHSMYLPALIYLLPWGNEINEETEMNAAALTAMTISIFIHDDTDQNRAFTGKEAVLNGDFLFALSFNLLPATAIKETAADFVKAYGRFNEGRLNHKSGKTKVPPNTTGLSFESTDYALLLWEIARLAAKDAEKTETEQTAYTELAGDIGTLWEIRLKGYDMDVDGLIAKIEKEIANLPWTLCLMPLLQSMK
ncbi:MAG TPA: hypothetical protein PKD52_05085 [Clostridiales bacterium]|nr:hypothetical protein [Clostridiales bacterium]